MAPTFKFAKKLAAKKETVNLGSSSSGLKGKKVILSGNQESGEKKKSSSGKSASIKALAVSFSTPPPASVTFDGDEDEEESLQEVVVPPKKQTSPGAGNLSKFANRERMKKDVTPKQGKHSSYIPSSKPIKGPVLGNPRARINMRDLADEENDSESDSDDDSESMSDSEDDDDEEYMTDYAKGRNKPSRNQGYKTVGKSGGKSNNNRYNYEQESDYSSASSAQDYPRPELRKPTKPKPPVKRYEEFFDEDFDKEAMDEAEKNDLVRRLSLLQAKGAVLSKKFTNKSKLVELRMEIGRIERERQVASHILLQQRGLMVGVAGLEKSVMTFGPAKVKKSVSGFSSYIHTHLDDYNSGFERMSEKFDGSVGRVLNNPFAELAAVLARHCFEFFFLRSDSQDLTAEQIQEKYPAEVNMLATKLAQDMAQEFMKVEREKLWNEFRPYMQQARQTAQHVNEQYVQPVANDLRNMFEGLPPMKPSVTIRSETQDLETRFARDNSFGVVSNGETVQITEETFGDPKTIKILESVPTSTNGRKGKDPKVRNIRKLNNPEEPLMDV